MSARRGTDERALAAYLEGEVTASARAALELELENSAESRRTLQQMRRLTEHLAAPAHDLEGIDLVARVRAAMHQPLRVPSAPRRALPVWLAGLAACLGALLLYVTQPTRSAEFRAKSNARAAAPGMRWAGIQAYRAVEHGTPEPLTGRLAGSDGLLFSYTNLGPEPFDYLMIFAVDARGEVSWFYPPNGDADDNPQSISISHDRANVPLGEIIRQDLARGPLALYGLFTRQPVHVNDIEARLNTHERPVEGSPIAGPGETLIRIDAQVAP